MEAADDHATDRTLLSPQGPTYTRDRRDQRHEAAHDHAIDRTLLPPKDPRIRLSEETRDMKPHMNMQKSERLQGCANRCHLNQGVNKHVAIPNQTLN